MPTQEERLNTVEYDLKHFKTETIKAYGDMAMELVMHTPKTPEPLKKPPNEGLANPILNMVECLSSHL